MNAKINPFIRFAHKMAGNQSYSIFFTSIICGLVLLLVPQFSHRWIDITDSTSLAIESVYIRANYVADITLSALITFDVLLDKLYGIKRDIWWLLVFANTTVLITSIVVMYQAIPHRDISLFWTVLNVRDYLLLMMSSFFLIKHGGTIWSGTIAKASVCVIATASCVVRQYSLQLYTFDASWKLVYLFLFCICFFLIVCINTLRHFLWLTRNKPTWQVNDYSCLLIGILFSLTCISIFAFSAIFGSTKISEISVFCLSLYEYSLLFTRCSVIIFYRQLNTFELIETTRKALEVTNKFVRYVSQEIRSPLQSMLTGISLLENSLKELDIKQMQPLSGLFVRFSGGPGIKDKIARYTKPITETLVDSSLSCRLACDVLNNLLATREDIIKIHPRVQVLYPILLQCLNMHRVLAKSAHVRLQLDCESPASQAALARIDESKIKHVLSRIMSNAIKFSGTHGSVVVEMFLITREKPKANGLEKISTCFEKFDTSGGITSICIRVVDIGVGLSKREQHSLMQNMKKIHSSGQQDIRADGTGLTTTYDIVKKHGGDMGIHSDGQNMGTVFWIELPLETDTESSSQKGQLSDMFPLASFLSHLQRDRLSTLPQIRLHGRKNLELGKLRVLCVDDVSSIRILLRRALMAANICETLPDEACDGSEAVEKIKHSIECGVPYDLILMDMLMPKIDGLRATRLARELLFNGLIVGLTCNALEEDIRSFKASGADDVFVKPMDIKDLKRYLFSQIRLATSMHRDSETREVTSSERSTTRKTATSGQFVAFVVNLKSAAFEVIRTNSTISVTLLITVVSFVVAVSYPQTSGAPIEESVLDHMSSNSSYRTASVSFLTASAYMAVEIVSHYISGHISDGRFSFFIAVAVAVSFGSISIIYPGHGELYSQAILIRDYLNAYAVMIYIWHYSEVWNSLMLEVFFWCLASSRFIIRYGCRRRDFSYSEAVTINVGEVLVFLILLVQAVRTVMLIRSKEKVLATNICGLVYGILYCLVNSPGTPSLPIPSKSIARGSNADLIRHVYDIEVSMLLFTLFHTRLVLWEYFTNIKTADKRRVMVRYISHDIRSPLNTLTVSFTYLKERLIYDYLNFLKDMEISVRQVTKVGDRFSVLTSTGDVKVALAEEIINRLCTIRSELALNLTDISSLQGHCDAALTVINNLLIYEKLDGDILALDIAIMPAMHTLLTAVERVALRLTDADFMLSVDAVEELASDYSSTQSPKYFIKVDVDKIDRVMRNVVDYISKDVPEDDVHVGLRIVHMSAQMDGMGFASDVVSGVANAAAYVRITVSSVVSGSDERLQVLMAPSASIANSDGSTPIWQNDLRLFVCNGILSKHSGLFRVHSPSTAAHAATGGSGILSTRGARYSRVLTSTSDNAGNQEINNGFPLSTTKLHVEIDLPLYYATRTEHSVPEIGRD